MAIYKSDIVDINLETGSIYRSFVKHSIGTADNAADRFGVRVFRNGEEVDLSGCSCYGYFQNSNGDNIALTSAGTVDGNVAYVTLPQACYNYEGNFCLAIKLLISGVTSTVRIVDGVVDNTNTGSAVAPTETVPTYSEILDQYDAMVAATAVANGAIATTFNAATVYPAGSYVINSGALYRITADHAANVTWANTSKVATNFGAEVQGLKSAINIKLDIEETEQTSFTVGTSGKYIKPNMQKGTDANCSITTAVKVKKGEDVTVYTKRDKEVLLAYSNATGSGEYVNIPVTPTNNYQDYLSYQFTSEKNGYFVLSTNGTYITNSWYKIAHIGLQDHIDEVEESLEETQEEIKPVTDHIVFQRGKNLFDKSTIVENKYINTSSGYVADSSQSGTYAISDLIPVEAGKNYYLYRTNTNNFMASEIAFYQGDGVSPLKPLNTDGTEKVSYALGDYGTISGAVKAPSGAKYCRFTVKSSSKATNYNAVQFEEGTEHTSYAPYWGRDVVGFPVLPMELTEVITIANSNKIGFFGNSYLNGGGIRTHHTLDNLGMFSDYIMYNYGISGDDVLELLDNINSNDPWEGYVPVQDWGISYGVIAMRENDGALSAANPETYFQNVKKLAEAIRAMGAIPILGTEHNVASQYYGMMMLSQQEGYMFMDWGKFATAIPRFYPFWNSGHNSTRTNWLLSNGMKPYLDTLPRPERGIKLFRKRPDTSSTLSDLVYCDVVDRARRFVEVYNGYTCITKATEKYFDRLDTRNQSSENVYSEYQQIQNGGAVNFGTHALIECILPYTKNNVTKLLMKLAVTGVSNAYIKRTLSFADPLPAERYIAFCVTSGAELLTAGTTFTVTGGVYSSSILGEYEVNDVVNGMVITTTSSTGKETSGTDIPEVDISGVTLAGSYDYPSADYMERYSDPLGEWDEIVLSDDGTTDLTGFVNQHMDFDKIAILLVGTNVTISGLRFEANGTAKKQRTGKPMIERKVGTPLLSDVLLDDGTSWDNINSVPKYTPVASTVNQSQHESLPNGITTVREISSGNSVSQTFNTSGMTGDKYHLYKMQVRILARYFPEYVDTDEKWATSDVYEGSYDCCTMSVKIDGQPKFATFEVGAFWGEFIADAYYQGTGNKIVISCDNKSLQIAKVELDMIG